jgi:hypothetical protein
MVTVDGIPETALAAPRNANEPMALPGAVTVAVSVAVKVETTVVEDVLVDDLLQPDSKVMASVSAMRANRLGRINLP